MARLAKCTLTSASLYAILKMVMIKTCMSVRIMSCGRNGVKDNDGDMCPPEEAENEGLPALQSACRLVEVSLRRNLPRGIMSANA